jgi:hypothetical protein
MAGGLDICRGAAPLESLWQSRPVVLDGVGLGHATAGVLLGLTGLRVVPMVMLAVSWQLIEYAVRSCGPASFLGGLAEVMRPWGGYLLLMMIGWSVGRLGHWLVRRRREAALFGEDELPSNSSAIWPRRPEPVDESAYFDDELTRNFFAGSAQLELDDRETDELRAALSHRLAQLRSSQAPDAWEHIGTLETLLARLPARRARAGSSSVLVAS